MRGRAWGTALAALCSLQAAPALAHAFSGDGNQVADAMEGLVAVLTDLAVVLMLGAAGLLASLCDDDALPLIWPSFMAGIGAGMILALVSPFDPVMVAYCGAMLFGGLAALAPRLGANTLRACGFGVAVLALLAILTGHPPASVPAFSYVGIVAAVHLPLVIALGFAGRMIRQFPQHWCRVALRAGAAWIVAIAAMGLAFSATL